MKTRNFSTGSRNKLTHESPHSRIEAKSAGHPAHSNNVADQLDVVQRSVARSGLTHASFVKALTATALGRLLFWNQSDLERLLIAAERLGLDPIGGDIYAVDRKAWNFEPHRADAHSSQFFEVPPQAASYADTACPSQSDTPNALTDSVASPVVLVLSVDGWSRIINAHAQFDGMNFQESEEAPSGLPTYIECTIYRKDRRVATSVREYMAEANTGSGAWLTHPRRMLRHKAMVQCARLCFGLGGVYEPDEAERIKHFSIPKSKESAGTKASGARPMGTHEMKRWLGSRGQHGAGDSNQAN